MNKLLLICITFCFIFPLVACGRAVEPEVDDKEEGEIPFYKVDDRYWYFESDNGEGYDFLKVYITVIPEFTEEELAEIVRDEVVNYYEHAAVETTVLFFVPNAPRDQDDESKPDEDYCIAVFSVDSETDKIRRSE